LADPQDLASLEEGNQLFTNSNSDHCIAYAGEAMDGFRFELGGALHFGLDFQAGKTPFIGIGHDRVEWGFGRFIVRRIR